MKHFQNLFAGIKLDVEEREIMRQLTEQAGTGEGETEVSKEMMKSLVNKVKDRTQIEDKDFSAKKRAENISALMDTHGFWDNQPVPKTTDTVKDEDFDKAIDTIKTVDDIQAEPYALPDGFHWANVDIMDDAEADDVYELLNKHYVEDDGASFRFDYSVAFLRWALKVPGSLPDMIFGVRGGKKNKLFGFIAAIPITISVNGSDIEMVEINFLCVHKQLRTKRLAPILIREVTRRTNRRNVWQAAYTAGVMLPTPISDTTYFHRCINTKKVVDIGFFHLPQNTTMQRFVKRQKLPDAPKIAGIRPMEKRDVSQVAKLLNEHIAKYKVHVVFSEAEVEHYFLPREGVLEAYVVDESKTGEKGASTVTDFISFYSLPSSVLKNPNYSHVNVAYAYYIVPGKHGISELFEDALIFARTKDYDVFNALNIMGYGKQFEENKFAQGDGFLHYYLYNWRVRGIKEEDIAVNFV